MNQHLGQIGAVRLVFWLIENQLNRAHNPPVVFGNQQGTLVTRHAIGHPPPETERPILRQRMHETDGRAAIHAINQQRSQSPHFGLGDRG